MDAIHLADHAIGGEAFDDRHEVGHPRRAVLEKHREFNVPVGGDTAAQQRFAARPQPVESTGAPPLGGLAFGGASVFGERRLPAAPVPTKHPSFVNRMQRVDQYHGAGERQSVRDEARAETREHGNLGLALQPDLGDPGRNLGNLGFRS